MTAEVYENRQALFDAARVILDAQDSYEGETRIKKWAVVLAAHVLDGKDKLPRPSKTRFGLSEYDIIAAKTLAKEISDAITAAEAATFAAEKLAAEERQKYDDEIIAATPKKSDDAQKKARILYDKGLFLKYAQKVLGKVWYSDGHILQAIMYIGASYHVKNADEGLHLHVGGTTQSGKSDSVKTSLKFLHPDNRLTQTFSDKWLFYAGDKIRENMAIFADDTHLSEEAIGLFRNLLTSWHDGVKRGTVLNQQAVDQSIPRHVNLILTSIDDVVENSDDGQDESRFLSMEVRRTPEDEREIRAFIQEPKEDISRHLSTIHQVWEIMPYAEITMHKKIEIDIPTRDFKRFITLMKCNAILHNRTTTTDEDMDAVEKFLTYSRPMVDATTAAYSRKERAILDLLKNNIGKWVPVSDIKDKTGMSIYNVYRAIRGTTGTFDRPTGGLMLKEKKLQILQEPDTKVFMFKIT